MMIMVVTMMTIRMTLNITMMKISYAEKDDDVGGGYDDHDDNHDD